MIKYLCFVYLGLFISCSNYAFCQNEFFHEIVLEKKLIDDEKWELNGEANSKYLYNEPKWNRWGVSIEGLRKVKGFKISGSVNGFYTFNNGINNFLEFRPATSLLFAFPLFKDISLRQGLRYEWRYFYTVESNATRENYGRLRYQIGMDIPIPMEKDASFKIRPFFEWFFIREPATFERYSNERDFGIMLIKSLKNESKIFLSYKLEKYYEENTQEGIGHAFLLGYSF